MGTLRPPEGNGSDSKAQLEALDWIQQWRSPKGPYANEDEGKISCGGIFGRRAIELEVVV
eukprot:2040926-Prymnesium_polylepis.2